jgi:anti-sigma B factor antagonist
MDIERRHVGTVVVLTVHGDITQANSAATRIADIARREIDFGHRNLLLDLAHVRYVDSAGLGELVRAFSAVKNRGGALKLVHLTDRVNSLLVVTKLLTVFEWFDSEAEAIDSFSQVSPLLAAPKPAAAPPLS